VASRAFEASYFCETHSGYSKIFSSQNVILDEYNISETSSVVAPNSIHQIGHPAPKSQGCAK
jgi:hypothetical protein